jgi:hypothetical protein
MARGTGTGRWTGTATGTGGVQMVDMERGRWQGTNMMGSSWRRDQRSSVEETSDGSKRDHNILRHPMTVV